MNVTSKIASAATVVGLALALGIGAAPAHATPNYTPSLTAVSVTCTGAGTYTVSWKAAAYPYGFSFGWPGAVLPAGSVSAVGSSLPGGQLNPFLQTKIPGSSTSASIVDLPLVFNGGQYLVTGTVALPGSCLSYAVKHSWFAKHRR